MWWISIHTVSRLLLQNDENMAKQYYTHLIPNINVLISLKVKLNVKRTNVIGRDHSNLDMYSTTALCEVSNMCHEMT